MASSSLIDDIDRVRETIENGQISRNEAAKLLLSARRLTSTLETAEEKAWRLVTGPTVQAVLMAVIRMDIFEVFKEQTMTAAEIAEKTGADQSLVVRLMRALSVVHIFQEVGDEKYAQNDLSIFFGDKNFQDFLFGIEFNHSLMLKLPDFLESIKFKDPLEPNNGLLQFAQNTKLSTIDWLKANPKKLEIVSKQMTAQSVNWRRSDRSALSSMFPPDYEADVLIVDVGGGRGSTLEELRAYRPDLKGRMIFQDIPEVLAGVETVPGVEAMVHDFFKPQPIKGASVYFLRNVLHDWPDESCQKILENVKPALAPYSRVVIQDQVIPTTGATLLNVGVDIAMMIFSGMERSEKQWKTLLESAGLEIVRILPPEPHPKEIAFFSTIEAVMKN